MVQVISGYGRPHDRCHDRFYRYPHIANVISQRHFALMIPIPAGCARFLCYGWIITGVVFVLGLNKNGEDLSGAGLLAIGLGVLGLYVTRPRKD